MEVKHAVVVVTGASRGIGKAMLLGFAREGARVVGVARNADELAKAIEEAQGAGAAGALGIPADVTAETDVERLAWQIDEQFGRVDVLVNHVGGGMHLLSQYDSGLRSWARTSTGPAFWDFPLAWWEQVQRLNVTTTFLCSKIVTRRFFVRQRSGSIVNTSSGQGVRVMPVTGMTAYGAAKAAVNHLTRLMAAELRALNVAANAILVPLTKAGAVEGTVFETTRDRAGGWYRPEVVVPVALHLAGQDATGVTGEIIHCLEWLEANGLGPRERWKAP
jgi:NAD(P)-dependent dehydrogenase (short-subunit alcohol dehydrogenase family)